jgi:outer membrane receptor protein involved in Fe transport
MKSVLRRAAIIDLLMASCLYTATPSMAATTATPIAGQMGPTAQACLQQLTGAVGGGENCMYDSGPSSVLAAPGTGEITGPFSQIYYYDYNQNPAAFSVTFVPTHNSGQISQVINGSVSIDDSGTPAGTDDLISFNLTLTSPLGGDIIRHTGDKVVDKYTSMTQILAPRAVDAATSNVFGGYDYVIGSEGFPTLLTFNSPTEPESLPCAGQLFGSMDCRASFSGAVSDPDRWSGVTDAGLGSLEGNTGVRTTGTVVNLACIDTGNNNDCQDSVVSFAPLLIGPNLAPGTGHVTAEDAGWDQLLLKVSTNAAGQVVTLAGFDVQEFQTFGAPFACGSDPGATAGFACNSWSSGYFTAIGIVANDDGPVNTPENVAVTIDVMANDTGFSDPVTVTISTPPTQGTATVLVNGAPGNQGNQADIMISYIADVGASGDDTLIYTVTDGANTDSATVALAITVPGLSPEAMAGSIAIGTRATAPLDLTGTFTAPGNGGSLGNFPATVSVTTAAQHGAVTVSGATLSYRITDAAFFTGMDVFGYTITDNDGETDSGDVTVTIADLQPAISVWAISADQDHASAAYAIGQFIQLGNGAASQHEVTVSTQAEHGTCIVSPANATGRLVYTPADGYSGSDSCQLTVRDGDLDPAIGTVNITVNPLVTVTGKVGGAGALDLWGLLLLGATLLRRALRNMSLSKCKAGYGIWRTCVGGTVFAILALDNTAVYAQDTAGDGLSIQEIIVTSRKVEENLKEVPLAITAFDEAGIAAMGINNLTDLAEQTPGLSFFNAFGETLPTPVIRGVVPTDIFGENNAAIFVDGVYVSSREGLNFSQIDIARIEVVKGPQSALYGRNAFSGAINYVTKRPSDVFEGKATIEAGNDGKMKGLLSMTGPLLGQSLLGRASVLYDEWDGSYDNSLSDIDIGGYRYRSLQGSLLWLPSDDLEVALSYYKSNDDLDGSPTVSLPANCEDKVEAPPDTTGVPVQAGVRFLNYCGKIPEIESIPGLNGSDAIPRPAGATGEQRELDRVNLKVDWDLAGYGTLSSLTGYSTTRENARHDFARGLGNNQSFLYCSPAVQEGARVPNSCTDNGMPTPANLRFFSGLVDVEPGSKSDELSQELRFTSPADQRFRYTSGVYWYQVKLEEHEGKNIATVPPPNWPSGIPTIGLPPFQPTNPDFAVGTAIFYNMFADDPFTPGYGPDGGLDPLRRVTEDRKTEGWALFTGLDYDLTDRLTARGELRVSQETRDIRINAYSLCTPKGYAVPDPGDPTALIANPCGDDLFDTRVVESLDTCAPGAVPANDDGDLICSPTGNSRFEMWTGRVGLNFQATDDWMVYGSIAYGEKPGGLLLLTPKLAVAGSTLIVNTFEPETMTAYEIGAKGYLFDRRLSLDISVYLNDWRQIVLRQLIDQDPATGERLEQPIGVNVNAGDATVLGAEISAALNVTEFLTATATLGWVDAELDNARQDTYALFPTFRADCGTPPATADERQTWFEECNSRSGDVSGNTMLRQPEWMGSASLSYDRPLTGDWNWYTRGDISYQSDVYTGNDNQNWLPAHTYVNAKLGLRSDRYTVELWARNLFDDGHPTAAFRDIYLANTDNQYAPYVDQGPRPNFDDFVPFRFSVTYPRERTYGISATVRFGESYQ